MNMKTMTTRLVVAIVAVACLAVGTATSALADGQGPKAKTKIAFKSLSANGSSGVLTSKKNACLGHRKVSLFEVVDFVSDKVEIVYSNDKGKWKTKKNLEPGVYFAKVDAANVGGLECLYGVTKNTHLR
jgi:hypothetical protein